MQKQLVGRGLAELLFYLLLFVGFLYLFAEYNDSVASVFARLKNALDHVWLRW